MVSIYQFKAAGGWEPIPGSRWDDPAIYERYFRSDGSDMDLGWEVPTLQWTDPGERPDVTGLLFGALIFDPVARPELVDWFSYNGKFEEMGGDAEGLTLVRFPTGRDIGYDRSSRSKSNKPKRLAIDLPDDAIGFCGAVPGLGLVSIEERPLIVDPSDLGFRAWARLNDVTGLRFKIIWDSGRADLTYDQRWGINSLRDPSILD